MNDIEAPVHIDPPQKLNDALPVGARLGEFEVRRVLGIGGFGIVYLAWDHALEREVALKEYLPVSLAGRGAGPQVTLRPSADVESFATGLRSFVNEARLLARFDHPSLVKVHRFWEDHGTAYMVMPFYRGRTLREVRRAMTEPYDEASCRRLVDPLLSALELLHSEGVFHRDIAPDNILLGDDGVPVLLDFGAARRVLNSSQSMTAILKPSFAPLEQYDVSATRQGAWTDLYGLGATVHYLLTGRPPPPAAARALGDELAPLAQQGRPGCSVRFLGAIDWTLALAPQARPQSVAALRDALDGRVSPSPAMPRTDAAKAAVHAPQASGFEPTRPVAPAAAPGPSRRFLWVGVAAAVALLVSLWWVMKPAPKTARAAAKLSNTSRAAAPPVAAPEADSRPATSSEPATRQHPPSFVPVARPMPAPGASVRARGPEQAPPPLAATAPSEVCGGRNVVMTLVCMKRQCLRPVFREHLECQHMADQERISRENQREP